MQEERKADEIQKLTDQTERLQCQKDLAQECQCRHRVLVKEQNPKPKKWVKNINDVSQWTNLCCIAQLIFVQVLWDPGSDSTELADLAELSRPNSNWKSEWNGNRGGANRVNTNTPIGTMCFSGHISMLLHVRLTGLHSLSRTDWSTISLSFLVALRRVQFRNGLTTRMVCNYEGECWTSTCPCWFWPNGYPTSQYRQGDQSSASGTLNIGFGSKCLGCNNACYHQGTAARFSHTI